LDPEAWLCRNLHIGLTATFLQCGSKARKRVLIDGLAPNTETFPEGTIEPAMGQLCLPPDIHQTGSLFPIQPSHARE